MARGLRCRLGMHRWVKQVVEGETSLVCARCGRRSDGPSSPVSPPVPY